MFNHTGTVLLETERLILRGLKREDAPTVFKNWTSDTEVAKFMRWNPHADITVITENNITDADMSKERLLEEIVDRDNMNNAFKRVKSNKGAHGVDGMKVDELLQYLKENGGQLRQSILDGKYCPNPVRRVEIPKEDGKKRRLGIPMVVDRVVQQAIAQVLTPIFEKQFSDNSYGFRPRRSAHDAIRKCQNNVDEGYKYVVRHGLGEVLRYRESKQIGRSTVKNNQGWTGYIAHP
jgi:retron-type reverse transcriptase